MMHATTVDQTTAPEVTFEKRGYADRVVREARPVPPGLVLWSEELEARRHAVERWRGVKGTLRSERKHLS